MKLFILCDLNEPTHIALLASVVDDTEKYCAIKYLKIKNYPDSQAYSPFDGNNLNEVAIRYGDYPLAHYLYLVTFQIQIYYYQTYLIILLFLW